MKNFKILLCSFSLVAAASLGWYASGLTGQRARKGNDNSVADIVQPGDGGHADRGLATSRAVAFPNFKQGLDLFEEDWDGFLNSLYSVVEKGQRHEWVGDVRQLLETVGSERAFQVVELIAGAVGTYHPREAMEWVDSIKDSELRRHAEEVAIESILESDLEIAKKEISRRLDRDWSVDISNAIAGRLAEKNPREAVEWVHQDLSGVRGNYYQALSVVLGKAAHRDFDFFVTEVNSIPDGTIRHKTLSNIGLLMGLENPKSAVALVQRLSETEVRADVREHISVGLVRRFFGEAPDEIYAHAEEIGSDASLKAVKIGVSAWMQKSPSATLAWFDKQEPDVVGRLASTVIPRWAEDNPLAAARFIYGDRIEPDRRGALAKSIASQWAINDPVAALEWVVSLPDEHVSRAFMEVVSVSAEEDIGAAIELVEDAAVTSAARDRAIRGIVHSVAKSQPEKALDLILRIEDEAIRDVVLGELEGEIGDGLGK